MTPSLDYHALAPELIVTATLTIVLLVDLFWDQVGKRQVAHCDHRRAGGDGSDLDSGC
ncbi:MAG: hypothetical protein H6512_13245 [Acidimicrobiia bacterium]|nr:hypothetical protein [Acidimicrobiia bacterium]